MEKMSCLLAHRGPDNQGLWVSDGGNVVLAHRRLSIIDISDEAKQPMVSYDGRYMITYNGEIYNYSELRETCRKRGSRFNTHCDTEVVIEYLRHYGVEGLKDFRGMWAFVIYDIKENTALLSRNSE